MAGNAKDHAGGRHRSASTNSGAYAAQGALKEGTIKMDLLPLDLVWRRAENSRRESRDAFFLHLLYVGEALLKTYTAALVAALPDERDRHRYSFCHKLIRASGIGEWDDVLGKVSGGPASQHLLSDATPIQRELTESKGPGHWVYDSALLLHRCLSVAVPGSESLPRRVDGRRWFTQFVQLRNKTRGHGAPTSDDIANMIVDLEDSLRLYQSNSVISKFAWAYVRRNLSGKYNVARMCGSSNTLDRLKGDRSTMLQDGTYIDFGSPCKVELIETTLDLTEFFYPNGQFRQRTSEWLSYISGTRQDLDVTAYMAPATPLPPSSTDGARALDIVGKCFANLPPRPSDYVLRSDLEADLTAVLTNDRHPIVTLVGRGGIGKTSLALEVLHRIAHGTDRFNGIVWFSARDIDLLPHGPKLVQPATLTAKEMAKQFLALFQPSGWDQKGFDAEDYLAQNLRGGENSPLLLVFDNFETVQQPVDAFQWLDTHARCPNKVLITTRHRDFKGDYPVEVGGMTEAECNELVRKTGAQVGIGNAITQEFCRDIYRESEGHPYVVKVLVGEAADGRNVRRIERIVAGKDDLLDALFERTYKRLSPAGKRIFLTLSNWRSLVAQVALDAALLRRTQLERIDVPAAIEELRRVSFADEHVSPADNTTFVSVSLVAGIFGRRKLSVSHEQAAIEDDTRFLQRFGAMQLTDLNRGIEPRIQRFFASFSEDLSHNSVVLCDEMQVLELIARSYSGAWLMIADLWRESLDPDAPRQVTEALTRYLEATGPGPQQRVAWERIGVIKRQTGDWAGFVNSQVQIAELPGADLSLISSVVNTFNSISHHLDLEARKLFAQRLVKVMEPVIVYGDATDCSRLAWLFLRCDREERAVEIVDCGLKLDPLNEYCKNLKEKILSRRAASARDAGDWMTWLEATIGTSELTSAPFAELSEAANVFNQHSREWAIGQDARHRMALRISRLMEPRIMEGDATDCSRLAWVLIYLDENDRARRIVNLGLQKTPDNEHCIRLNARL